MKLSLVRDPSDGVRTFGTMTLPTDSADTLLQTLERPWIPSPLGVPGGHPYTSCVPAGVYALEVHDTITHPQTWALVNHELGVYHQDSEIQSQGGRALCLIHSANVVRQLAGCIAVGLTRSLLNGEPDVASSGEAFRALKEAVPWVNGHTLTINERGI